MINQPVLKQESSNIRNMQLPQNLPHYRTSQQTNPLNGNFDLNNQHPVNINSQTITYTNLPKSPSHQSIMSKHPSMPKINFKTNDGQFENADENKKLRDTIQTQVTENNRINSQRYIKLGQTNRLNSTVGDYQLSHRSNVPVISASKAKAINQNLLNANGFQPIRVQQNVRPISTQLNSNTYPSNIPNNYNKFNQYQKPVKLFSNKQQKLNFYKQKRSESIVAGVNAQNFIPNVYQNPQNNNTKYLSNNSNITEDIQYTYKQRPQFVKTYNNDSEWYRTVGPQEDPVTKKTNCNIIAYFCVILGILGLLAAIFFGLGLQKQWFSNNNNVQSSNNAQIQNENKNQIQPINIAPINNQPTIQPINNNIPTITPITYPTILPTTPINNGDNNNNAFINPVDYQPNAVLEPNVNLQPNPTFIQPSLLPVTVPSTFIPAFIPQISNVVNPEATSQVQTTPKPVLVPANVSSIITTETTFVHPVILPQVIPVNSNVIQPQSSILPSTIPETTINPIITPTPVDIPTITPTPVNLIPTVIAPISITPIQGFQAIPVVNSQNGDKVPQNFKSKLEKEINFINGNFKANKSLQLYDIVPQNFKAHFTKNKTQ